MKYRKSKFLNSPNGNSIIWRYMDDWKFRDLVKNRSLFFCNAKELSDAYEVTLPKSVLAAEKMRLHNSGLDEKELNDEMSSFYWVNNPMKELVMINCWSNRVHESYALWKIYLSGKKNGVAIRTTLGRLKNSILKGGDQFPEEFFLGNVNYGNYIKKDQLSRFAMITKKKPFYDFENEVRAFIMNYPISEGGYETPYDLSVGRNVKADCLLLLKEIFISPFADDQYEDSIRTFCLQNHLNVNIRRSKIMDS